MSSQTKQSFSQHKKNISDSKSQNSNSEKQISCKKGHRGYPGKTILSGQCPPFNNVGNDGDFYIDLTKSVIYGPKYHNKWSTGVDLYCNVPTRFCGDIENPNTSNVLPYGTCAKNGMIYIYIGNSSAVPIISPIFWIYSSCYNAWMEFGSNGRNGNLIYSDNVAPPNPDIPNPNYINGDIWMDTNTGEIYSYDGTQWIDIGLNTTGSMGSQGPQGNQGKTGQIIPYSSGMADITIQTATGSNLGTSAVLSFGTSFSGVSIINIIGGNINYSNVPALNTACYISFVASISQLVAFFQLTEDVTVGYNLEINVQIYTNSDEYTNDFILRYQGQIGTMISSGDIIPNGTSVSNTLFPNINLYINDRIIIIIMSPTFDSINPNNQITFTGTSTATLTISS